MTDQLRVLQTQLINRFQPRPMDANKRDLIPLQKIYSDYLFLEQDQENISYFAV